MKSLKELRKENGLTQKQASVKLGVTSVYLSMIERAIRNPGDPLKERMAKLYGVSEGDIFLSIKETKRHHSHTES